MRSRSKTTRYVWWARVDTTWTSKTPITAMDTTERADYCYPQHWKKDIHQGLSCCVEVALFSYMLHHQSDAFGNQDREFLHPQSHLLSHLDLTFVRQDLPFLQTILQHTTAIESTVVSSTAMSELSCTHRIDALLNKCELCAVIYGLVRRPYLCRSGELLKLHMQILCQGNSALMLQH
jgi:hypothetical protein